MNDKVIGVYPISNFGGIEILAIEGDTVKWRYNFGEPEGTNESEIFDCVENEDGEEVEGFFANDTLIEFSEILRVNLKHNDNEKVYIETLNGISYEYLKQNKHETYLFDITNHYFDIDDLNRDKWFCDDNGYWYTFDKEEIRWFEQLNEAYDNLSQEELESIHFNEYDDIIDYYNGKKVLK